MPTMVRSSPPTHVISACIRASGVGPFWPNFRPKFAAKYFPTFSSWFDGPGQLFPFFSLSILSFPPLPLLHVEDRVQ